MKPVVYVHGIGSHPRDIKQTWDTALFGKQVAFTHMAYWAHLRKKEEKHEDRMAFYLDVLMDKNLREVTKLFLHDVYVYCYDDQIRNRIKSVVREMLEKLNPGLIIGHSLGSMIVYDVLRDFDREGIRIPLVKLITVGSPLGLEHIRAHQRLRYQEEVLRVPDCVYSWDNYSEPKDPVCLDKTLSDDYDPILFIMDHLVHNLDPRNPHGIAGYLKLPAIRSKVKELLRDD